MKGESVCQAVSDGETSGALQLSQHDYHLPEKEKRLSE